MDGLMQFLIFLIFTNVKVVDFYKLVLIGIVRPITYISSFELSFRKSYPSCHHRNEQRLVSAFFSFFHLRRTYRSHAEFVIVREGSLTLKIKYELVLSHVTSHTYVSIYRRFQKNVAVPGKQKASFIKI